MINHFCTKPLWECTQTLAAVAQGRQIPGVLPPEAGQGRHAFPPEKGLVADQEAGGVAARAGCRPDGGCGSRSRRR